MTQDVNRIVVLKRITNMDQTERDRMASIYATLPEMLRSEAMRFAQDIFYRIRTEGREAGLDAGTVRSASLAMAVAALQDSGRYLQRKQQNGDTGAGEKLARVRLLQFKAIRIKRQGRTGADREWLRIFYPTMERLREEGLSYRDLAIWIRLHHRRRISSAYVHRIYRLTEAQNAGRKEIAALTRAEKSPPDD
jgi:hypothetical protein